jgi:hypothetical protein
MYTQTVLGQYHQHIDNGGVTITVVDKGVEEGIYLHISTQYYGYPCVSSEVRLDPQLDHNWLNKVALMFLEASNKMKDINLEARFSSKTSY